MQKKILSEIEHSTEAIYIKNNNSTDFYPPLMTLTKDDIQLCVNNIHFKEDAVMKKKTDDVLRFLIQLL